MNKKIIWTLSLMLTLGSLCTYSAGVDKLQPIDSNASQDKSSQTTPAALDPSKDYYPNATVKSIAAKYKMGNYSGCLQETFSYTKRHPSSALAYYYQAMAYTHLNMKDEAVESYNKVLSSNPDAYLSEYAVKGRDCLTDGPACHPVVETPAEEQLDDLDKFIRAPYGNGLSPELNNEVKQKQLINIQETINKKENLENKDIQRIKDFDSKNKSSADETIKIAQVSDEDVLKAVNTLKEAGLNVTVQSDAASYSQYQDPRMAEMSLLLGSNNNNNSNNMMNMLPMLMSQAQKGENIDPRIMQTMMLNSMMSDFSYADSSNK